MPTASAPTPRSRGDREVYTPQVVVDGAVHALGSDKAAIEKAIAADRSRARRCRCRSTLSGRGDKLTVTVPAVQGRERPGRSLALPDHASRCRSRSAAARTAATRITYTNVVRRWIKLGDWTGKAASFDVPVKDFQNGADRFRRRGGAERRKPARPS